LELNWTVCPYCATPVVKAISAKTARAALPAGSGYAALEPGEPEMPAEPASADAPESAGELLPEPGAEPEPVEEP
jgi:hypothetical protein